MKTLSLEKNHFYQKLMKDKNGKIIQQGDIYWINFDPSIGAEIQKKRPAIVVQDQDLLQYNRTILVCPIISSPNIHPLDISLEHLKKNSRVRTTQLKALDIGRFCEYIKSASPEEMEQILERICMILGK